MGGHEFRAEVPVQWVLCQHVSTGSWIYFHSILFVVVGFRRCLLMMADDGWWLIFGKLIHHDNSLILMVCLWWQFECAGVDSRCGWPALGILLSALWGALAIAMASGAGPFLSLFSPIKNIFDNSLCIFSQSPHFASFPDSWPVLTRLDPPWPAFKIFHLFSTFPITSKAPAGPVSSYANATRLDKVWKLQRSCLQSHPKSILTSAKICQKPSFMQRGSRPDKVHSKGKQKK